MIEFSIVMTVFLWITALIVLVLGYKKVEEKIVAISYKALLLTSLWLFIQGIITAVMTID